MKLFGTRWVYSTIGAVVAMLVVAACGGAEPTATALPPATPTAIRPAAPTATSAPTAPSPTPRPTATPVPQPTPTPRGPTGTLSIAIRSLEKEVFVRRHALLTAESAQVVFLFTDGLVGLTPDRQFEGRWVREWSYDTIGADNVLTLRIRPGVVINEGWGTITAEHIKFNFTELVRADATNLSDAGRLFPLIDRDINNLEIVSPMEVKLHSAKFNPIAFLSMDTGTGSLYPWQAKVYSDDERDDRYNDHPIGTGPFVFKSRVRFSKYTLEAVPNHWRKTPSVQTVNLLIAPEGATRLAMLKAGQADMALLEKAFRPELTGNLRPRLVDDQVNAFVALGGMYYDLPDKNCTTCPWVGYDDKARKVREALTISIDRQTILDKLLLGMGKLSTAPLGWFPGAYPWVDPSWQVPAYDPAKAKRLLAEAGYPNGFEIKMALFSLAALPEQADIGEAVAGYWETIGIRVERRPMEFRPGWFDIMVKRDTAGWAWVLQQGLPFDIYLVRTSVTKEGSAVYFLDPKATEWAEKAGKEPDFQKRAALGREMGARIVEQRLMVPLFSTSGLWGLGSRVATWDNVRGFIALNNVETVVLRP